MKKFAEIVRGKSRMDSNVCTFVALAFAGELWRLPECPGLHRVFKVSEKDQSISFPAKDYVACTGYVTSIIANLSFTTGGLKYRLQFTKENHIECLADVVALPGMAVSTENTFSDFTE